LDIPLLLLLFGIVYIIDSVSSMIQIVHFKFTGKRIFKIAPFHHNLELRGWSELKIVFWAAAITSAMSAVSLIAVLIGR